MVVDDHLRQDLQLLHADLRLNHHLRSWLRLMIDWFRVTSWHGGRLLTLEHHRRGGGGAAADAHVVRMMGCLLLLKLAAAVVDMCVGTE